MNKRRTRRTEAPAKVSTEGRVLNGLLVAGAFALEALGGFPLQKQAEEAKRKREQNPSDESLSDVIARTDEWYRQVGEAAYTAVTGKQPPKT